MRTSENSDVGGDSQGAFDVTFESIERTFDDTIFENVFDVDASDNANAFTPSETRNIFDGKGVVDNADGKTVTATVRGEIGLKTVQGVRVENDLGYELVAVEETDTDGSKKIALYEGTSGEMLGSGDSIGAVVTNLQETIDKVGKENIDAVIAKNNLSNVKTLDEAGIKSGRTSALGGDRLSVGRAVADADYTNKLLSMAKESGNEKARRAAEAYSSYKFNNEEERYRALGDIAKILGVSESDLVRSKARSLFHKALLSISQTGNRAVKLEMAIESELRAAKKRGDTSTVKALEYLSDLLESEGSVTSVAAMFEANEHSAENPNVAVQVYGKRMETAFKNIGLDISVSVYYDSSENAARGEWTKHPDGHSEIRLNGAKLQGEQSAFWVVSHELIHEAESKSPGITQRMLDAFTKMGMYSEEQFEAYKARYNAVCEAEFKRELDRGNVTQDDHDEFVRNYVNEEIVADLMSETMSSSELVEVFAGKLGEDDANVIVSFLKKLLNGVKKVFNSKDEFPNKFSDIIGMFEGAVKGTDAKGANVNKATENVGVQFDSESKSAAPQTKFSYATWSSSEYVQNRDVAASALAKAVGVSKADAERYINNINSIAKYIADNKERLDYEPNLDEAASVLKSNQDYKWTVDMSTLCAKRLITTGTFDAIQKALPNTVFDSEDIVHLRDMMMQRGYEVACGICYVESTRRELGPITADFIERYKESQQTGKPIQRINSEGKRADLKKTKDQMETTKDKSTEYFYADKDYTPTLADLNTTDIDRVKVDHPLVYEAYLNFMNARGQAKPKLLETRAEYKGEILKHFKQKNTVNSRNNAGGLRLQSFSDFEIAHLIDMMQITLDMSKVGLMSQAYTKVPAFAEVFGGTGIKINLSLIAKDSGLDADGNLIFDDVEGINHEEAFRLRDKYSENVGTILVGKNDAHIRAAMADPRIDFIIPFHKSSWKESLYDSLGLRGYKDYTDTQHEKPLDKSRKIHDFQPSEYWDYSKSGDKNADIYLKKCREDGRIPKFPKFAGKPGYWKLLIDFKMYDNNGVGSPQTVVKPEFDMDSAMDIMEEYKGGHQKLPVAQDVVDDFVAEYKGETDGKTRFALSGKGLDNQSDSGDNTKRITADMSDSERTEILTLKSIAAPIYNGQADSAILSEKDNLLNKEDTIFKAAIKRIGEQFDVFTDDQKPIPIEDMDFGVFFSRGSADESSKKKVTDIRQLAKILPILRDAVENSIGIECHDNRYFADHNTKEFYELLGGYIEGNDFIPVRFGVKSFKDGTYSLYVVVCQDKIKKTNVTKPSSSDSNGSQNGSRLVSDISISQISKFVKGKGLLRYLPDGMLDENQRQIKYEGIAETIKYTNNKNDEKYRKFIKKQDMDSASRMVKAAAQANGYTQKMFHETDAENIHIFDISRGDHGGTDSETPYGIFTKSSDKNIGLGSRQMALYVKADNTLHVKGRAEVKSVIPELVPYYDKIAEIDKYYDALLEKLEDAEMDALYEWVEDHPDVDMDEVYPNSYIAENKPADIDYPKYLEAHEEYKKASDEWKQKYNEIAVKCKDIITSYLRDNNYDSMYFEVDGGSRGRQTDSLILLDKNQVKSADTVTYDDDGNVIPISERFNPEKTDIRYSLTDTGVYSLEDALTESRTRFALSSTIEQSNTLIAAHNLSVENLKKSIKLGGLPGISVAVTNAEKGHTGYGDVTILFGRSSIDPEADERNRLYSEDAYTPTMPESSPYVDKSILKSLSDKAKKAISHYSLGEMMQNSFDEYIANEAQDAGYYRDDPVSKLTFLFEKGVKLQLEGFENVFDLGRYINEKTAEIGGYDEWYNANVAPMIASDRRTIKGMPDKDFTPDNIVSYMESQPETMYPMSQLGVRRIGSIDEAKRLEIGARNSNFKSERTDMQDEIVQALSERLSSAYDVNAVPQDIWDILDKYSDAESIRNAMKERFGDAYSDDIADMVIEYKKKIGDAPARYFEAKLYRTVDFDEPVAVIVPDSVENDFINELEGLFGDVEVYKSGDNESRKSVVNDTAERLDARFALGDYDTQLTAERVWEELLGKYGAIPKGEKAARDVKVPKKISDNKYVSRTARSAIEAGITPAEFVPELQKEILDGKFTYERFPDEKAEAKAKETIEYHGFEGALEHWEFLMHSGGAISKENFSLGIALYNQCAQNGDFARAEKILADLSVEATRAGQAIQSMRLLKKMSADGTMYYLEKSIDKINDELVEKFGEKRAKKVKINEELARKYFAEKDAKKREKLYDELCKDIGEQIPSTFWEKADAWRYVAMLFNPTTHIRNVAGNILNKFVIMADHAVEGALQPILVKRENRTRTWRIADKKTADFAKNDWELMRDVLTSGEGKYNNMMSDIDENRRILRPSKNAGKATKAVGNAIGFIPEVLRKFNSWGLEAEDAIFLGASYKSALRKIITARKLNVDNITPEQLSEIRDLAMKDALRATFREANWLAESISKAKSNLMKGNAGQKLAGIALGGVFPFTKTPMNITKQALEHSPLGVFKTASDIVKKARGGAVSGNDIIADLARTFTGTGLAVLGFVLARAGFVSAGDDEDPDKKRFDKLVGEQSYAITVGGKSYTIDWATPASIPFLVGAQLFDATSDSGINIKTAIDSLTKIAEPVIGLSMLDGLRDFMQSDNYAEGQNPLFAGAYSTLESYVLQFFPTLGGKIHRIYDGEKKNYYFVDKNSNVPEFVQELYGSVASKLPFAVGNFQPSVDLWGRIENHGGIGERLAENLISPGYYSEENYTEVDEELLRLYESTGNGDVFPKKMYEDITIDGHKYYMNAEHYTEAAVMLGERRFDMLSRLFNDEIVLEKQDVPYSEMSDSEKAKIVSDVYYQALDETKYAMFDKVRENSAKYGDVPELDSEAKIRIGAENAEIFYKGNPTGENAYNYEIYSRANDFLKKTDKILADADLSDEEQKKAEADILEYANAFPFEGTRGGELAAAFYDKIYNNGKPKFDIEYGDIFSKYSEYIDVDATIDGKKYKENLSVGDYLELSTNIAVAEEILRITVFGTKSDVSTYAQPLMEQYKNEPWMQIVKAASENIPKKDEDKAAFYKSVTSDVRNGIKNSYDVKYIKEASSGNDTVDRLAISKDMSDKAYSAAPDGTTGAQRVYWTQKYNFADQAYKAIQGDKSSNKAGYIKDLETLSEKYDGKLSRGDKLIAENYDKAGNDDVFYTGAESYVLEKSKDGIKYEMPMSYHDYKSMTKYMDDAKEYAALYVFGNDSDKSSASKIRNQNGNMKTWVADGLKATNSAIKGNYDLYKRGKLSADEYNAIYYKTLVGKIKSEIRASYRESYFKKRK